MQEIFNRRSVRHYRKQTIPQAEITRLLQAAMRAPSAGNQQPWEFIVVKKRESLNTIPAFHEYASMLPEADCAIVVCGNRAHQKFKDDYWVQDCAAATQNLLLEAVHLGIGAVWLGVYPLQSRINGLRKLLELPEEVTPFCIVSLGYPAQEPKPLDTYKPERVHQEAWQEK